VLLLYRHLGDYSRNCTARSGEASTIYILRHEWSSRLLFIVFLSNFLSTGYLNVLSPDSPIRHGLVYLATGTAFASVPIALGAAGAVGPVIGLAARGGGFFIGALGVGV